MANQGGVWLPGKADVATTTLGQLLPVNQADMGHHTVLLILVTFTIHNNITYVNGTNNMYWWNCVSITSLRYKAGVKFHI